MKTQKPPENISRGVIVFWFILLFFDARVHTRVTLVRLCVCVCVCLTKYPGLPNNWRKIMRYLYLFFSLRVQR
jgi:hypothetical protein